jgi:hypothetical protein
VVNLWNRNAIVYFLRDLIPVLPSLDPVELYALMRRNGLLAATRPGVNSNRDLIQSIAKLASVPDPEELLGHIADELGDSITRAGSNSASEPASSVDEAELTQPIDPSGQEDGYVLPSLSASDILHAVDQIETLSPIADEEAIEFFIAKAVGKLWREKLANPRAVDVDAMRSYPAGEYASVVRARFLEQLEGAESLAVPEGYRFHVGGQTVRPNLMQRLVAYRLLHEKRLGNWSGTGAGKTMAAILASRCANARLTLIVALNNTLDGWKHEILNTFPDSGVILKQRGSLAPDPSRHTYLLLNFETFQQADSSSMVQRLVDSHRIDMVVLDEVHSVKQRAAIQSKRRQVLGGLLTLAAERNPDLHVLGMSATPVVNNLMEAVSLLEMVKGARYSDLRTRPTLPNVVAIHEKLVTHGVRYRPQYSQVLDERCVEVPGEGLIPHLQAIRKGDVLGIERVLLEAKVESIVAGSRPGTLIYSHFVEGIVPRLREVLT